jgi:transcriptional regulator with XRE-family HTH domain
MIDLEGIKARLQDRKVQAIHEATGLSKLTIAKIRDGKNDNPGYETLKALSDYFEGQEQKSE